MPPTKSQTKRTCKQFLVFVFIHLWYQMGGVCHPISADPTHLAPSNIFLFPYCIMERAFLSARAHHTLSTCGDLLWCDQWLLSFAGCLLSINKHHAALFCVGLLPVATTRWQPAALLPVFPPYRQSLSLLLLSLSLSLIAVCWISVYLLRREYTQRWPDLGQSLFANN